MIGSTTPSPESSPLPQSLRGLAGSSAIFALGNGLSRAAAYALPPLLAGWMVPAEMGTVALLSIAALIARTVIGLGLTTSAGALWFDQSTPEGRNGVIATAMLLLAAGSTVGMLVCGLAARPLSVLIMDRTDGGDLILLALAGTAVQSIAQPATMVLQFQRRPIAHLVVTSATAAVGIGLAFAFVAGLDRGVRGWLEAGVISSTLGLVLAVAMARISPLAWRTDLARDLVQIGWPFVPGAAFMAVVQGAGAFILARTAGIASAGIYNAGYSLGMIMAVATTGFSSAWFPYFQSFAGREAESRQAFSRVLFLYIGIFGAGTVLFYAMAPLARILLVDPRYHDALAIIGDVALLQMLIGLWGVLVPVLYFRKRIWMASAVQGLAAVVTLMATMALVHAVGLHGAAWGALVGVAAMILAQVWINRRLGGPASAAFHALHGACLLVAGGAMLASRWLALGIAPLQSIVAGILLAMLVLGCTALSARRDVPS